MKNNWAVCKIEVSEVYFNGEPKYFRLKVFGIPMFEKENMTLEQVLEEIKDIYEIRS